MGAAISRLSGHPQVPLGQPGNAGSVHVVSSTPPRTTRTRTRHEPLATRRQPCLLRTRVPADDGPPPEPWLAGRRSWQEQRLAGLEVRIAQPVQRSDLVGQGADVPPVRQPRSDGPQRVARSDDDAALPRES